MKKTFTITSALLVFFSLSAFAQPVITDSSNIVPIGYGDSVSVLVSAVSPGPAGANQTWDFSALSVTPVGYAKFVTPASTPYAATYPTATRAVKIDIPTGTIYEYDVVSATKWEQLASNVSATTGDNYSVNAKTMIPFNFHYNDIVVDTFYKNAVGPYTVTMTYDGYGTVITPFGTYSNVVRMKRSFGGNDYYYDWYATSPYLYIVVSYDNNTQQYTFTGSSTTGVNKVIAPGASVSVYPNPFSATATIAVDTKENMSNARLQVTDITGRVVKILAADKPRIVLDRAGISSGLYFYTISNNEGCLATGKISVE